jgi:hypothetical protein
MRHRPIDFNPARYLNFYWIAVRSMKYTTRIVWLGMLGASFAVAQETTPDPVAIAQRTAQSRSDEWAMLSQGMEARLSRLLPCDRQVKNVIDEVNRASQARMAAIGKYLAAAAAKSRDENEKTKVLLARVAAMAADVQTDLAETQQERTVVENQMAALNASLKATASAADARKVLAGISEDARQRATQDADRPRRIQELGAALRELVARQETRQAALKAESMAIATEDLRWDGYYAARMARAEAECTVTNPPTPAPRPQRPQRKSNP